MKNDDNGDVVAACAVAWLPWQQGTVLRIGMNENVAWRTTDDRR